MIFVLPTFYALYNLFFKSKDNRRSAGDQELNLEEEERTRNALNENDLEECGLANCAEKSSAFGTFENITTDSASSTTEPPCVTDALQHRENVNKLYSATLSSSLFALGLAVSGMILPSKISGFFNLFTIPEGTYDPTLLTVMIGGCLVSMISYQFVKPFSLVFSLDSRSPLLLERPLLVREFSIPCNRKVDIQLIGGSFCFGIGWGVAYLCPGP
jgi:hypothetical protein